MSGRKASGGLIEDGFFILLLIVISAGFLIVLAPFFSAILWAVIIGIVFAPLYRRLLAALPGRRNGAALLALLVVVAMVILPATILTLALIDEASAVVARFQSGDIDIARGFAHFQAGLPGWGTALLERMGITSLATVQDAIGDGVTSSFRSLLSQMLQVGQSAFGFLIKLSVTLYLAFFLLRDGESLKRRVAAAVPLRPDYLALLGDRFVVVIRATVKGSIVVAVIQGLIGGLVLWALGIDGALLWGVLMGAFSLLPAVGTGIIWVPMALYLLFTGQIWQGMVLVFCGLFVIGMVDNVLRPILVGHETRIPDYVVLIATLGGLELFGFHGIIIGPVVAAMFIAIWNLMTDIRAGRVASGSSIGPA
jgi:predicted PurR-regulated permease PerM